MATAALASAEPAHRVEISRPPQKRKQARSRFRWRWVLVPAVLAAGAGAWKAYPTVSASLSAPDAPPPRTVAIGVSALGRLAPESEVIAVAPTSATDGGRVDQLLVAVGDKVKAGQVVAVLDPHRRREASVLEAQAQVEVARAKLAQVKAGPKPEEVRAQEALVTKNLAEFRAAERDLGRASLLFQKAASSHQEFDDQNLKYKQTQASLAQSQAQLDALNAIPQVDVAVAAAELAEAEAGLQVARADLEAALVRSPISGRVLRIRTRPGERVGDGGILEVGNTDQMHAVAEVYEQDVGQVKVGQSARVRIPTLGAIMIGEVVRKDLVVSRKVIFSNDPVADIDARVVEVHVKLSPEDSASVAGLSNARAEVVINTGDLAK